MFSLTMAQWKMLFGFGLLFVIAVLAGIIAIKHVEQSTSFGLEYLLGGLTTLAGGFANWAFGESRSSQKPESTAIDNMER